MDIPDVHTHENKTLYLETERGERYVIHPNGDVERTDMLLSPSGQWKVVGVLSYNCTSLSRIIPLHELTPEWRRDRTLRHYKIVDFDHGTYRVWEGEGRRLRSLAFYDRPEETPFYQYVKPRLQQEAQRRKGAPLWG